jgi:hypothetical protein
MTVERYYSERLSRWRRRRPRRVPQTLPFDRAPEAVLRVRGGGVGVCQATFNETERRVELSVIDGPIHVQIVDLDAEALERALAEANAWARGEKEQAWPQLH